MIILDANILLYAENLDDPRSEPIRNWLLASTELIAVPWISLWAFLRLSTAPKVFATPLRGAEAFRVVKRWLETPGVVTIEPGPRHAEILERLVIESRVAGSLVTDAVLATLAIENGATLASTDRHFARFKGLKWVDPLAAAR